MVGRLGEPDLFERRGYALFALGKCEADQPGRITQIVSGAQLVVKTDRMGQIAHAPLDRQRLARWVKPKNADLALRSVGEPEQHQNGRRLPRTVRAE